MNKSCPFVGLLVLVVCAHAAPIRVIYPRQEASDNRDAHKIELLERVLRITEPEFGPFLLVPSSSSMTESRMDALMAHGDGSTLNVIFKPTTRDREETLVPIRIPLLKGLLGYRVFLIHADAQPAFSAVRTLEDLRSFTIGQGLGWRDVEVFAHHGIPVAKSTDYEALFAMLVAKRFDAFCRGITEAPHEFEERKDRFPDMRIETDLLLYYPWPVYFFTMNSPEGRSLARRIALGLDRLLENGEFDVLFDRYYAGTFTHLNLERRHLIRLSNPLLPPQTPLENYRLWLSLEKLTST